MPKETMFTFRNLWAAAIVDHLKHWDGSKTAQVEYGASWLPDSYFQEKLCSGFERGEIEIEPMRKAMIQYSVVRSVKKDRRERLAMKLFELCKTWPNDLVSRSRLISDASEWLKENQVTHTGFHSGLSKLIWFIKPDYWTMYDSFAYRALAPEDDLAYQALPSSSDNPHKSANRSEKFYFRLNQLGFCELCDNIRPALENGGLQRLYPERIVDKSLWILGSHHYYRHIFDVVSNDKIPDMVWATATKIDEAVKEEPFVREMQARFAIR